MDKKFVLITGGTSGIGLSTIRKFLSELKSDVEIISISRSLEKINKVKQELKHELEQVLKKSTMKLPKNSPALIF